MAGYVRRPNKKGGDWVKRWVEIGVPADGDPSGFADNMCCYKAKDRKKLLNNMKMYAASNIRLSDGGGEDGVFIIEVNKKEYPFMANSQESARTYVCSQVTCLLHSRQVHVMFLCVLVHLS